MTATPTNTFNNFYNLTTPTYFPTGSTRVYTNDTSNIQRDTSTATIAGSTVASVLGALAILYSIFLLLRRRRRSLASRPKTSESDSATDDSGEAAVEPIPFLQIKGELSVEQQLHEMEAERERREVEGREVFEMCAEEKPGELKGRQRYEMEAREGCCERN